MFRRPGMSFADWHVALMNAVAGDGAALEARVREMDDLVRVGRYPSGPIVPALTRAFAAFQRQDYSAAIDAIEPMLTERERIGGSRAQIDLVAFTLVKAYLSAGGRTMCAVCSASGVQTPQAFQSPDWKRCIDW
jgi:hypothetical protein